MHHSILKQLKTNTEKTAARLLAPEHDYTLIRWLFIRGLGVIYVIAFLSLWLQIDGLLGSDGILPASRYIEAIEKQFGPERFWFFPTLFWLNQSDLFLHLLCGVGILSAVCVATGIVQFYTLLASWAIYLSLVTIGQDFLSFQWDVLLLETGLFTLFIAPGNLTPKLQNERPPGLLGIWLLRWLMFRLMFLSGMVKWLSGDPTWQNLTALFYHYETQPLPTIFGWYAHQLPDWFHQFSCLAMFVIEVAVPFLIFTTRRLRTAAAITIAGFQLLILFTGNYCFFNLLTMLLCLPLLDDRALKKILPEKLTPPLRPEYDGLKPNTVTKIITLAFAGILFVLGNVLLIKDTVWYRNPPQSLQKISRWISPLRSINSYGLFRVMTTTRNEIVIQGSDDQTNWKSYDFKWKPDDVTEAPGWVAPHQPRLDWQMWFAALGNFRQHPWFLNFMEKLLKDSEEVTGLLQENPFPDAPPRYIRALLYQYEFSDLDTKRTTGKWWVRRYQGRYCPTLSLRE